MVSAAEESVSTSPASASAVVQVRSSRFGDLRVPVDRVLHFPQGLIGFAAARRFVILDHRSGSPFKWMVCLDDPDIAFAVAEPARLVPDYRAPLDAAARALGVEAADVALFVIVTIPPDPLAMTVNLMAPVVVDMRTRRSRQLVLEDERCDPSYRVCAGSVAVAAES
ncbi:MAG: flagellar assembly protein FliW [Myxococcales bacterium]|jgi:flagellar assembly factor FliW|nr:flagellar assembly protein FliW [Myxococcales bacterium]